jgi:nitroimidazol reductase NimA-like FMN-containing flavoprotein (pyridoxamine 5'-phosphate oxidase superfamily)
VFASSSRGLQELGREEALRLLAGVPVGCVVFSMNALPAIRPVNHLVDGGDVINRTHDGSALIPAARRDVVVADEADDIDPVRHVGWSVVVTGRTEEVTDPEQAARYRERLRPWVDGAMDLVIRIRSEIVTAFALVDGTA